jgi:thiol-disulfide isomerase/thioredoxin
MRLTKKLIWITILVAFFSCKNNNRCVINGRVHGISNKAVVLLKAGEDGRPLFGEGIDIPIKEDSTFHYELTLNNPEGCHLFLDNIRKVGGRFMLIMLEPGVINITVYPENEFDRNTIEGGKLNRQILEYNTLYSQEQNEIERFINSKNDSLENVGNYYSATAKDLIKQKNDAKSKEEWKEFDDKLFSLQKAKLDLSDPAIQIYNEYKVKQRRLNKKQCEYIRQNQSIVSYYLLIQILETYRLHTDMYDLDTLKRLQEQFAEAYKYHPYANYGRELLLRYENEIKTGGYYFDFKLNDINGNKFTLSEEISGKYAVIDIWAPWCGSCIAKSLNLVPLYEEFKNKGFTVVGVVSKYRDIEDVRALIEKLKYPWLTLIDVPDWKSEINLKYNITNEGGTTLLVDKSGKVRAIKPSIDEVRTILMKELD